MEQPEQARWWSKPFRTFQTNLREIDAGLDVEQVLDHIVGIGANTWLLNTAGIVSFYPSELEFQHPSPWLSERPSHDLIGDALTAAHSRGVRVLSRVDFSKMHRDIAERHPDWCFVAPDGRRQIYNGLYSTCPSAPYYQERSFDILGEVLERYPVDGFFFNWFGFNVYDYSRNYYGICQCSHCRRRFADRYGVALPTVEDRSDPHYLQWREYVRDTLNDLAGRIRQFISERRPGAPLILGANSDIAFHEANNAVDRDRLWVYGTGQAVRASRTAEPAKPVWVNSVLFIDMPYRFVVEQPGQLQLYLSQSIAYGANPSAYMVGTPNRFTPEDFDAVADILRFHRDHEEYYTGLTSAADVLVLTSLRSEEYYGGADGERKVREEFRGVYQALTEEHVPFDIVAAERLTETILSRYRVVVLPNVACLDGGQRALLDGFVRGGGGLVATYDSAGYDTDGTPLIDLGLDCLGAAQVVDRRESVRSAYLRDGTTGRLILLDQAFLTVTAKSGAAGSLTFIPPSSYGPPEKCYWDIETEHPGLLSYQYGDGRSAYLPWPVGALYYRLNLPEHRRILADAVRAADTRPPRFTTDAPASVELAVGAQAGRTIVHLINYSGQHGRAFHDPLPIADITVRVADRPVRRARSLRLGVDLEIKSTSDGQLVRLPRLESFDALVLE